MPEVNEVVGGYKLRNLLSDAQFTQVFEVVEQKSHRHFAMKMLHIAPGHKDFVEQRQMLLNEAAIGIKLKHENVVSIQTVNKSPKTPYFVMEYFPAGSLKTRLMSKDPKDKLFLFEKAKDIFKQMATGLAYMNAKGYVHCDIKPDNVLVNSLGQTKLIDFAISKSTKGGGGFLARLFGKRPKAQGTHRYMSPEQINAERLDGRADVYCYGMTLYELTTGRTPFFGANPNDLLKKHLTEQAPPLTSYNPELTDEFSNFVLKMIAKKKADRPQNFHEVMMALRDIRIYKVTAKKPGGKADAE